MRKKGFTLVELLVVIAIIAMLLAILMPALNKVRQIAYRMVCGSNLSGLGKACLTYANDYQESYPVYGGSSTLWSNDMDTSADWDFDITTVTSSTGPLYSRSATVTASMYLLVKYADVSTGQFVCKATDSKKFDLSLADAVKSTANVKDVTQVWDFGPSPKGSTKQTTPWQFCSYSYQLPYKVTTNSPVYPITASTQAGTTVFADKNPWVDPTAATVAFKAENATTGPHIPTDQELGSVDSGQAGTVNKDKIKLGNSLNHQSEGQNVLYADSHVAFETTPQVGIEQDNIFTVWANPTSIKPSGKQGGIAPAFSDTASRPQDATDSFLVH